MLSTFGLQAQWVLEGPTPINFSLLNASGNIVYLKHNDDTVIIKNGSGPYQIIKQKNGEMFSYIRNTLTGFQLRHEGNVGIIERTKDGGYNWTELQRFNYKGTPTSMVFVNDTTGYLSYCYSHSSCINDYDFLMQIIKLQGKKSYEVFSDCVHSITYSEVKFTNDSIGYFISDFLDSQQVSHAGELRKTTDGGKTWHIIDFWSKFDTVKPYTSSYFYILNNIIVLLTFDKVDKSTLYISKDYGNLWEKYPSEYTYLTEFQDTLKAWGFNYKDTLLSYTNNLGKTWSVDTTFPSFPSTYFFPNFKCPSDSVVYLDFLINRRYYYVNRHPFKTSIPPIKTHKPIISDKIILYTNNDSYIFQINEMLNYDCNISLYTIDGKLLLKDKLTPDKNGYLSYILPVNNFKKGLYLINFDNHGIIINKKIIVQ
jgi:hypothetical protein